MRDTTRSAPRRRAGKKGGLEAVLTTQIGSEIERLIGAGTLHGLDFEAVETAARHGALRVAAQAVAQRLNADQSDHDGPSQPCPCGGPARYAGRRAKTFTTALGPMTLQRAYYRCEACGSGFFPRDRALGMEGTSLSPAATRMTGFAADEASFARTSELLWGLAGLRIDPKQSERTAEALGAEIAEQERRRVDEGQPGAPTLYLGIDGTGVPVRPTEREGRTGKQPDGSSKTREAKLAAIWWTSEPRNDPGALTHNPASVSYSAAIETAATRDTDTFVSPFAQRVEREARRRGFHMAQRQGILADGARWIWNLAEELFPHAIQIVDLFHAKSRLWEVAKAVYRPGTDLTDEWAHQRCEELQTGQLDAVIDRLRAHPTSEEALKCIGYLENNRHRMRYPWFREQALCISSAVVESGCKRVIGQRLKRGGMHWSVAGANAITALKCCILSARFEDFWERRASAT